MSLKLKRRTESPPAFSWDAALHSPSAASSTPEPTSLPSPPTSWLSARDMKMFGAQPLKSDIGIVKCLECNKPILKSAVAEHASNCLQIRSRAEKDGKGKVAEAEDPKKGSKKRKVDGEEPEDPSAPSKKKTKPLPKNTKGRFKGPIDYDRHCGVINDKNLPCSRSLTCKSHSMGAKRAVQGRSKDYDQLLLEWNRAFNPRFVEPVKRETKAEKKEKREKEKAEQKRLALEAAQAQGIDITKKGAVASLGKSKKGGKKHAAQLAAVREALADNGDEIEDYDDIDSEAEVDLLVKSVKMAQDKGAIGISLANPCNTSSWFVARREKLRNCRELLANALIPAPNRNSLAGSVAPGGMRIG